MSLTDLSYLYTIFSLDHKTTLLLEFLLCEEATTEAAIIYATSAARESIVFINPLITQPSSDPQGESHD